MICLGLEGTAHTIGIGLVDHDGNILANRAEMYRPTVGGIHPREAANHHAKKIHPLLLSALEDAGISLSNLELIAFSQGPGLGPSLRTVATAARALSLSLGIPIIGVNHCIAHLEIGRIVTHCRDPVLLYLSGGNTQVISYANGRYRIFGETLDIGLGNLLDKFGREVSFPFPSGPLVEKAALKGSELLSLPYTVKGMDVAFSGILTAALTLHRNGSRLEDLCFSLQEVTFSMVTEVAERAMAHLEKDEILLGGGVACNSRLQEMVSTMAEERGADMTVPPPEFCVDNGAMIAWTGLLMHRSGVRMGIEDTMVEQNMRTDSTEVPWLSPGTTA
ncbi:MAG: bifunctional N(6)-L-threonylcarbamoyladenine synthase/serine/threonine protein kinase [Candidatus Thermoplasmatota archaeon]|nr:bifunctional N(6)-L-threonylcarbamoyladenine synthase/serine/threonine protein kinase [Candidatus Thermoplasmatota archaeon]